MSSSPSDSDVVLPEWIATRAARNRVRRGNVGRVRAWPVSRRAATSSDSDSDSDSKFFLPHVPLFTLHFCAPCQVCQSSEISPNAYALKRLAVGSTFDDTSIAYIFLPSLENLS